MLENVAEAKVEAAAKVGMATTGAAASASWLSVGEVMQLGSTIVAVVAGIATAWYYIDKVLAARAARAREKEQLAYLQGSMEPEEFAKFMLSRGLVSTPSQD